ncbi:recombinase family protein [Streptomyces sp. NPDC004609]|uniref:recombinase family protein n=1 Tax=Streptomyces sp. NPDC004609 TaxID=3364704 RepID=UPI0036A2431F
MRPPPSADTHHERSPLPPPELQLIGGGDQLHPCSTKRPVTGPARRPGRGRRPGGSRGQTRLGTAGSPTGCGHVPGAVRRLPRGAVRRARKDRPGLRPQPGRPHIELAMLAEELKASDVGLEFLTGELKGSHDPSGIVFTVLAAMSGMEREYIRDRTLEGHESARKRGKTIGGAGGTDESMLSMALHLREQEMSLRDIAKRLVITTGPKKGQHPSPATVMRMLREHDEHAAAISAPQ